MLLNLNTCPVSFCQINIPRVLRALKNYLNLSCQIVDARCGLSSWRVLFVVLLLCLVDPVWQCDDLVGEERVDCFAFLCFVACLLSVMACVCFVLFYFFAFLLLFFLFLFASLVDYCYLLLLFLDLFCTILIPPRSTNNGYTFVCS